MTATCAVVGCTMTADAAWIADDGAATGRVIETAVCGLHYPDLASGKPFDYDLKTGALTIHGD